MSPPCRVPLFWILPCRRVPVSPCRVASLQNTVPLATFAKFGEDVYFVADQRGYETVVHHVANQFLKTNKDGTIVDPRLLLNKVIIIISLLS